MANLNPMKVGKVVGQFLANVADGPDIGLGPDYPPLEGHVYFTARAKRVAVRDGTPNPATFYGIRHDVVLDENGYLTHNGSRGIMLAVPSPDAQPQAWTWFVEFNLTYLGQKIAGATSFDINVPEFIPGPDPEEPDEGSAGLVDLSLVVPIEPEGGEVDTSDFMRNYGGVRGAKRVSESEYAALELAGNVLPEVWYVGLPG
jgi:hypothetical protein